MRIVFMGTPEFAVPSLRILLDHSYNIVCVVTAPDKPRGRGHHVSFTPVKEFAVAHGLPVLEPSDLKSVEFRERIQALSPDLIVVVAFRILPPEVYTLAGRGAFNLHASLLPKYRGAAPINWAVMNGETETGVTTFFLQEKVDTGSTLLQRAIPIGPEETAAEVHDRLSTVGADVVLETVRGIEQRTIIPRPQVDAQATKAPKIFREHCRIDWSMTSRDLHNFIRGLSPIPCAWTQHGNKVLKVYRSRMTTERSSAKPGTIVHIAPTELKVSTGDGLLSLIEVQQEGKRRLSIEEFLRGYSCVVGDQLV